MKLKSKVIYMFFMMTVLHVANASLGSNQITCFELRHLKTVSALKTRGKKESVNFGPLCPGPCCVANASIYKAEVVMSGYASSTKKQKFKQKAGWLKSSLASVKQWWEKL